MTYLFNWRFVLINPLYPFCSHPRNWFLNRREGSICQPLWLQGIDTHSSSHVKRFSCKSTHGLDRHVIRNFLEDLKSFLSDPGHMFCFPLCMGCCLIVAWLCLAIALPSCFLFSCFYSVSPKLRYNSHNIKFTLLNAQFSDFYYIHKVVLLSPLIPEHCDHPKKKSSTR